MITTRLTFIAVFLSSILSTTAHALVSIFPQEIGTFNTPKNIQIYELPTGTLLKDFSYNNRHIHFVNPLKSGHSLIFKAPHYITTQSIILPEDLNDDMDFTISFQAIPVWLWDASKFIIESYTDEKMNPSYCQLITTISAAGKTLDDAPQGEKGAVVSLHSTDRTNTYEKPLHGSIFYFADIGTGKPFPIPNLKTTSSDGGVIIMNIHPGHYKLKATKKGYTFSSSEFECNPNYWKKTAPNEWMIINLSPPNGPSVQLDTAIISSAT